MLLEMDMFLQNAEFYNAELQIRGGIEDKSKKIFLVSQLYWLQEVKPHVWLSHTLNTKSVIFVLQ